MAVDAGILAKSYLVYGAPRTEVSLSARVRLEGTAEDSAYLAAVRFGAGSIVNLFYDCASNGGSCSATIEVLSPAPDGGDPTKTNGACGVFTRGTWGTLYLALEAASVRCALGGGTVNELQGPLVLSGPPQWFLGLNSRTAAGGQVVLYDDVIFRY